MTLRTALLAAFILALAASQLPAGAEMTETGALPEALAAEECGAALPVMDPTEQLSLDLAVAGFEAPETEPARFEAAGGESDEGLGGEPDKQSATVICGSWIYVGCCTTTTRYRQRCTFGPEVWYNYKCSGVCRF